MVGVAKWNPTRGHIVVMSMYTHSWGGWKCNDLFNDLETTILIVFIISYYLELHALYLILILYITYL